MITIGPYSQIPFTADFSNPSEYYYIEGDLSPIFISGAELLAAMNLKEGLFKDFSVHSFLSKDFYLFFR